MTTPSDCPQGYYCTVGTIEEEPCPVGTYGSRSNLKDSRECSPCPIGRYCWQRGLTSVAANAPGTGYCDSGYYCMEASRVPTPTDGVTGSQCPAGSYCVTGTGALSAGPASCAAGTFNAF